MIEPLSVIKSSIKPNDRIIAASYLVPHFSGRMHIKFPSESDDVHELLNAYDTIILNTSKPGWGSSETTQKKLLNEAMNSNWSCQKIDEIFDYCKK